jgi:Electron transfer DM13
VDRSAGVKGNPVIVVGLMLAVIGVGSVILQREIASTITAALVLSAAWAGLIGLGFLLYARGRGLFRPVLGGLAAGAVIAGGSYYWFSVRDDEVDEEVVTASAPAPAGAKAAKAAAAEPVNVALATGSFTGEDGHDGSGTATVIEQASGGRVLTFTDFDVDPGAAVEVWLTTGPNETSDRVDLGDLKGNVGDQQYEVPADADLERYGTVVLYCTPFTVRIAVADLKAQV